MRVVLLNRNGFYPSVFLTFFTHLFHICGKLVDIFFALYYFLKGKNQKTNNIQIMQTKKLRPEILIYSAQKCKKDIGLHESESEYSKKGILSYFLG